MLSFLLYFACVSIIIITVVAIIIMFCIRFNHVHRRGLPRPIQVFVIPQSRQHQLHNPQVFWSSSMEQPPPPYNAAMQATDTTCTTIGENNES